MCGEEEAAEVEEALRDAVDRPLELQHRRWRRRPLAGTPGKAAAAGDQRMGAAAAGDHRMAATSSGVRRGGRRPTQLGGGRSRRSKHDEGLGGGGWGSAAQEMGAPLPEMRNGGGEGLGGVAAARRRRGWGLRGPGGDEGS